MSPVKRVVILVAVLAVLTGAYVLLKDRIGTADEEEFKSSYQKVVDLKLTDVEKVTVTNGEDTFVITRDEDEKGWKLDKPADLNYDSSKVQSVVINAYSVGSSKVIEEDAQDLSKFGFDDPVVVNVRTKDGNETIYELGGKTPGGSYYMRLKESTKVYKVDSYGGDKIAVKKNDLRKRELFSVQPDEITQFSMERDGSMLFEAEKMDEYEWKFTYPIKGNVNSTAITPMLEAVSGMSISEFVEEDVSDMSEYGLQTAEYTLGFRTSAGGEKKILLGYEKVKDKEIYASLEGSSEVVTVSLEKLKFLDKPLKEIVEVFAYIVNINDVSRIDVEMDGYKVKLDIQTDPDDKDKDKFYVDGKLAVMEDENGDQPFRKYYQALIGVTLDEIDPDAQPEGEAEITFTYYLKKDPERMKVEFIPKNEHYYYVVRNGEYSGVLVSKDKFDEPEGVRDSYDKLKKAIKQQEKQ